MIIHEVAKINEENNKYFTMIKEFFMDNTFETDLRKIIKHCQRISYVMSKNGLLNSEWRTYYLQEIYKEKEELNKIRREKKILNQILAVSCKKRRERL